MVDEVRTAGQQQRYCSSCLQQHGQWQQYEAENVSEQMFVIVQPQTLPALC